MCCFLLKSWEIEESEKIGGPEPHENKLSQLELLLQLERLWLCQQRLLLASELSLLQLRPSLELPKPFWQPVLALIWLACQPFLCLPKPFWQPVLAPVDPVCQPFLCLTKPLGPHGLAR